MPIRRELYPPDWEAISLRVRRDRAGGRCECDGRCGRSTGRHLGEDGRCVRRHGELLPSGRPVVLTTAHLDQDPTNNDDDNLMAACQACHLAYDQEQHAATRAAHRSARLAATGQLTMGDPA